MGLAQGVLQVLRRTCPHETSSLHELGDNASSNHVPEYGLDVSSRLHLIRQFGSKHMMDLRIKL